MMNNKYFPTVDRWSLSEAVLQTSMAEMSRDGARGSEGVAMWLGRRAQGCATVTHVVALRGCGVIKRPAQLVIQEPVFAAVTEVAIELAVSLIGQIHSHGPGYGVDLSPTDRMYGVAVPYYLSLVAPDYAMRPYTPLTACGVHVLQPGQGFRRLSIPEINTRFHLTQEELPPLIVIEESQYV